MDPHSFCSWWVFQSESLFLSLCCIFTNVSCVVGVLNITVSAEAEASQTCVWQWDCERARERTHWHSHTKSACTGQRTSNVSHMSFIYDSNAACVSKICWCYCFMLQAEGTEKTETYSWLLCPKGLYAIILGFKHQQCWDSLACV